MQSFKENDFKTGQGMRETLDSSESAQLVALWKRRHTLSASDIGQMYSIVSRALQRCNPPELQILGEGRQELIAQFIYCKVLRLQERGEDAPKNEVEDDGHSAPSSSYALCAYFRRYLIDCTRASSFKRKVAIGDQITESQLEEQLDAEDDMETCLAEYGLCQDKVGQAAKTFIDHLDAPERVLLCESFGREAEGGLSGVAARHAISSYHYRAGRLGLVHKRQGLTSDYAKTMLGSWMEKTLGIPIHAENIKAIHSVFKILGVYASNIYAS
jgi:hypothetical protein